MHVMIYHKVHIPRERMSAKERETLICKKNNKPNHDNIILLIMPIIK